MYVCVCVVHMAAARIATERDEVPPEVPNLIVTSVRQTVGDTRSALTSYTS